MASERHGFPGARVWRYRVGIVRDRQLWDYDERRRVLVQNLKSVRDFLIFRGVGSGKKATRYFLPVNYLKFKEKWSLKSEIMHWKTKSWDGATSCELWTLRNCDFTRLETEISFYMICKRRFSYCLFPLVVPQESHHYWAISMRKGWCYSHVWERESESVINDCASLIFSKITRKRSQSDHVNNRVTVLGAKLWTVQMLKDNLCITTSKYGKFHLL